MSSTHCLDNQTIDLRPQEQLLRQFEFYVFLIDFFLIWDVIECLIISVGFVFNPAYLPFCICVCVCVSYTKNQDNVIM